MYKKKRILVLVPARAGSKGLPGKNIRPFLGKPLIAWTIEQALKSKYIDEVMVSTDGADIAKVALKYGAKVPFLRPKNLATDKAKVTDTIVDVMKRYEAEGKAFDVIMMLQPTMPLRHSADIDGAIEWLFTRKAESVVSVCPTEHSPLWCNTLPKDYSMKDFLKQGLSVKNRQELPTFYRLNGALYVAHWDVFKKRKNFYGPKTVAFIMPSERSVDIDTKIDFEYAEFLKSKRV